MESSKLGLYPSSSFDPIHLQRVENETLNQFSNAITTKDTEIISQILSQCPFIINSPLNDKDQTALIVAVQEQKVNYKMIKVLLKSGADVNYYDQIGLNAKDYAALQENEELCTLLESTISIDIPKPFQDQLNILKKNIAEQLNHYQQNQSTAHSPKMQIFEQMLTQLNRSDNNEQFYPEKLLDLYLTISTVFNLCSETDIKNKILEFLSVRENILRGDSHDYCYSLTLANQFCYQLVSILFPKESNPINVLMKQALTEERQEPWQDPYLLETNLPIFPGAFFRNETNHIHLYEGIVERAIANLKAGLVTKAQIWIGTDDKTANKPLTTDDLSILSQRTSTLAKLVAYTEELEKYNKYVSHQDVYERLSILRQGLLKGDANHTGIELNAGSEANIAIAEFADWWNQIEFSVQDKIRAVSNGQNSIGDILDIVLSDQVNNRSAIRFCIQTKGRMLEEILSHEYAREALISISNTRRDIRKSHNQLDIYKKTILKELENHPPHIRTNRSIFNDLYHSPHFMQACATHNSHLDYFSLLWISPYHNDQVKKITTAYLRMELLNLIKSRQYQLVGTLLSKRYDILQTTEEVKDLSNFLKNDKQALSMNKDTLKLLQQHQKTLPHSKESDFKLIILSTNVHTTFAQKTKDKLSKAKKMLKGVVPHFRHK